MNFNAQKSAFDRDILATEPEMPLTCFTAAGIQFSAQKGQSLETLLGQDAGYLSQNDFEIVVRVSQFTSKDVMPQTEEAITVLEDGQKVDYRVKSSTFHPDGVAVTYGIKGDS